MYSRRLTLVELLCWTTYVAAMSAIWIGPAASLLQVFGWVAIVLGAVQLVRLRFHNVAFLFCLFAMIAYIFLAKPYDFAHYIPQTDSRLLDAFLCSLILWWLTEMSAKLIGIVRRSNMNATMKARFSPADLLVASGMFGIVSAVCARIPVHEHHLSVVTIRGPTIAEFFVRLAFSSLVVASVLAILWQLRQLICICNSH